MPRRIRKKPTAGAAVTRRILSAHHFTRLEQRLEAAVRGITIANRLLLANRIPRETQCAITDAATARQIAETIDGLTQEERRYEFGRLARRARTAESWAWRMAVCVSRRADEDIGPVVKGERRGIFMNLIALRVAGEDIPQSMQDECLATVVGAGMLRRALAA